MCEYIACPNSTVSFICMYVKNAKSQFFENKYINFPSCRLINLHVDSMGSNVTKYISFNQQPSATETLPRRRPGVAALSNCLPADGTHLWHFPVVSVPIPRRCRPLCGRPRSPPGRPLCGRPYPPKRVDLR